MRLFTLAVFLMETISLISTTSQAEPSFFAQNQNINQVIVPTKVVRDSVLCDVGNAAMASKGTRYEINKTPLKIHLELKVTLAKGKIGSGIEQGIKIFGGVIGAVTGQHDEANTIDTKTYEYAQTPAELVKLCSQGSHRQRLKSQSAWLYELTQQITETRQTSIAPSKIIYERQFSASTKSSSGINLLIVGLTFSSILESGRTDLALLKVELNVPAPVTPAP